LILTSKADHLFDAFGIMIKPGSLLLFEAE